MPEPVTTSAVLLAAVKVLETSSNLIQGLQATAELLKAQEGLKYNEFAFNIPTKASPPEPKKNASAASKVPDFSPVSLTKPFFQIYLKGEFKLSFGITINKRSRESIGYENGHVILLYAKDFDTNLGSQAELEFFGVEWDDIGYLLTFKAWVNPNWLKLNHSPDPLQISLPNYQDSPFTRLSASVLITTQGKYEGIECSYITKKNAYAKSINWEPTSNVIGSRSGYLLYL